MKRLPLNNKTTISADYMKKTQSAKRMRVTLGKTINQNDLLLHIANRLTRREYQVFLIQ